MNIIKQINDLNLVIILNLISLIFLITAWKLPKVCCLMFAIMFFGASLINWYIAINSPGDYLSYADLSFFSAYSNFIKGWWFRSHTTALIGFIATSQFFISIGLLMKGSTFNVAALLATIFLLSIAPLGIGAGFPSTIIMAIAMYILFAHESKRSGKNHNGIQTSRLPA